MSAAIFGALVLILVSNFGSNLGYPIEVDEVINDQDKINGNDDDLDAIYKLFGFESDDPTAGPFGKVIQNEMNPGMTLYARLLAQKAVMFDKLAFPEAAIFVL